MDFIKYTINEDEWTIYLTEDDDDVSIDETSGAEVMFPQKEIYFRRSDLKQHIVLHELVHVYVGYCYLDNASLTFAQAEEVFCTLFSDKAAIILFKGNEIYNKLKELRENL